MKKIVLFALLLAFIATASAKERTEDEMRRIALSQFQKTATGGAARAKALASKPSELKITMKSELLQVFSMDGTGSVIVSRDDRFIPVLGYTKGTISNEQPKPCAFEWWMQEMERQMATATEATGQDDGLHTVAEQAVSYPAVTPFVTTKWGQDSPYNNQTPTVSGIHAPTGCVATALAQILNYNRYPTKTSFTGGYYVEGSDNFNEARVNGSYTYPFNDAYGSYCTTGGDTYDAYADFSLRGGINIARFLRDCGYAVAMNYGMNASGATNMETAYAGINYLSYPQEAIRYVNRAFYADNEWHNLIYSEVSKGYPVLYGGSDASEGGHAFVVHGIDEDGLVAVNWGWSGLYDGFFVMDAMNPGKYSFSTSQDATIGWHPSALPDDKYISQWAGSYTIANGSGTDKITLQSDGIYNYTPADFTGTVALCFEDYDGGKTSGIPIITPEYGAVSPFYGFSLQQTGIDEGIASITEKGHTYKVYMASSTEDESNAGIMQMARVSGGRKYYVMTVDNYGTPSITGSDFDTTSAINRVDAEGGKAKTGKMYNLSGQQVGSSYKGIVIKDGKKLLSN